MIFALATIAAICLLGAIARFPTVATVIWILVLETSPDEWLAGLIGGHETVIAVAKAFGLLLAAIMGLRFGETFDRYNPGFAFAAMFGTGLLHGLYPGLGVLDSLRSLAGSAAPFIFGFVRLPAGWCRAVIWTVMIGPLVTVGFGAVLSAAGIYPAYALFQGAVRLGGSGESAFLAGFALIAIYAGLRELVRGLTPAGAALLLCNLVILVLTGARAPLALALTLLTGTLLLQRRILLLAALGAAFCLAIMFSASLGFIRAIALVQLGEAADLSNRDLVWPIFAHAIATSPWVGWGLGAGKVVIPNGSGLSKLIATNAAHNEYLRIATEGGCAGLALLIGLMTAWVLRGTRRMRPPERWLMRAIFCAFAIHSATDNTLIATTSSAFFIWVSAVFATAG